MDLPVFSAAQESARELRQLPSESEGATQIQYQVRINSTPAYLY